MKRSIIIIIAAAVILAGAAYAFSRYNKDVVSTGTEQSEATQQKTSQQQSSEYDDSLGFSLTLPGGYTARAVPDGETETVFIENGASKFQIYIAPYDEPVSDFNIARIKKDIPDGMMQNAKEFRIADGGAVSFDDDAGHEIWFAVAGELYQTTAPGDLASTAEQTIATFKLK